MGRTSRFSLTATVLLAPLGVVPLPLYTALSPRGPLRSHQRKVCDQSATLTWLIRASVTTMRKGEIGVGSQPTKWNDGGACGRLAATGMRGDRGPGWCRGRRAMKVYIPVNGCAPITNGDGLRARRGIRVCNATTAINWRSSLMGKRRGGSNSRTTTPLTGLCVGMRPDKKIHSRTIADEDRHILVPQPLNMEAHGLDIERLLYII